MTELAIDIIEIILLCSLCVLFIAAASIRAKNTLQKRRQQGLLWLKALRELLSTVQQHRGTTTGYLNGSKDLFKNIGPLQKKVLNQKQSVEDIGSWIHKNKLWESINDHWSRLSQNYNKNTTENNLAQHNSLTKTILELIDDMATSHGLLALENKNMTPLHVVWRELLTTAELIGQTRAIGTGVTARQYCDSIARIRLNYLCQKIEKKAQLVWNKIPPDPEQQKSVAAYISCVNNEVSLERPNIAPATFFNIATSAIDKLHTQFDQYIDHQIATCHRHVS